MARTTLTPQTAFVSTASAASATAVDGASGNQFVAPSPTQGRAIGWITNTGANVVTAVMLLNTAVQGVTPPSQTATIPSATAGRFWAFPATIATQTDGNIYLDFSGDASTAKTMITVWYVPLTGV